MNKETPKKQTDEEIEQELNKFYANKDPYMEKLNNDEMEQMKYEIQEIYKNEK